MWGADRGDDDLGYRSGDECGCVCGQDRGLGRREYA